MLSNEQPFQLRNKLKLGGDGVQTMTLTGHLTLTRRYEDCLNIDPGGASRNLTASADVEQAGFSFSIYNAADAAENLVFKNSGGSTIVTIPQGGAAKVVYDGANGAWKKVIDVGTNASASILSTANAWTNNQDFGVSGTGVDVTFYGDTAGRDLIWDYSTDGLRAQDNTTIGWGSGAGTTADIGIKWDGTDLIVSQLTANSAVKWGVDGAGLDQVWYGDTASAFAMWDQSGDTMVFSGAARIQGAVVKTNGATSITTTRAVTRADSGGIFGVTLAAAPYTITVAQPTQAGERYLFVMEGGAGAGADTSLVATGCTFIGSITIDAATIVATGSTLKFTTAAAEVGCSIELVALSTTVFYVRAIASTAGAITIS